MAPAAGKGYFTYTVQPKAGLPTGTQIRNVALVTFDLSNHIATDQVDDMTRPRAPTRPSSPSTRSTPDRPPAASPAARRPNAELHRSWSGQDDPGGSGIASYNIYVSDNGGRSPSGRRHHQTSATFTGQTDTPTLSTAWPPTTSATSRQPPPPPRRTIQIVSGHGHDDHAPAEQRIPQLRRLADLHATVAAGSPDPARPPAPSSS